MKSNTASILLYAAATIEIGNVHYIDGQYRCIILVCIYRLKLIVFERFPASVI